MLNAFSNISIDHGLAFTLMALVVCVVGSVVSMRLFARTRRTTSIVKYLWLFLAGLICGGTIWTTHFVTMLGHQAEIARGYELLATSLSLLIAIGVTTFGMYLATITQRSALVEAGGFIIGLGISGMHYLGISALQVNGTMEWNIPYVVASIVIACGFGMAATNRVARPVTRFCKYGGATAIILAMTGMNFTGMAGLDITPELSVNGISETMTRSFLGASVLFVMATLLATAVAAYMIDQKTSQQASDRFRHMSLHDPLTGLANRTNFESRLEGLLSRQQDDTARVAIVSFNLDRFKEVNDVHGHSAGDAVLRLLAERLSGNLGPGEFVARFSGNEFLAIKHPVYTRNEAQRFAEKLRSIINEPIETDDVKLAFGASVGLALYPDDGGTPAELMERADLAMHRAKAMGRNRVTAYDADMDEASRTRSALAIDLRGAIDNNELELHYQMQNDVGSHEIVGFEVLLRWNHPVKGNIPPDVFIPIAEENGLILEIGEWVLREACREAASWDSPYKIAVNVATSQLSKATLPKITHEALLESGLPASRLELEVTESGIICDQQHALHVIRQIKNLGVKIAMDDYGTGYSSLSTLQNFPFDKIKIDREFIKAVHTNEQSAAIVRSSIILASSLNIPVLAEGVEIDEHMRFLKREGCNEVQGYLFGKPMPVADVRALAVKGGGKFLMPKKGIIRPALKGPRRKIPRVA